MDGAREHFLAGAALARDQHARIGAGDHVRLPELLLHDGAARDDVRAPVLGAVDEAGYLQRLLHLRQQLLLLDRLGQEAEGAHLRGVDGVGDRPVRGQQDDLEPRPAGLQLLEQADAVELVHAQVGDDEVGAEAAGRGQRLHAVFHRLDLIFLGAQADRQQPQQPGIVVDDHDACLALEVRVHFLWTSLGL